MVPVKRYVNGIRQRPLLKGGWHIALILLCAIVLILFVRTFLFIQVEVPVSRPDLGLIAGDRIVVNRMSYGVRWYDLLWQRYSRWGKCNLSRGDLVTYDYPDHSGRISIDRIKALPGDTLWLDDQKDYFTIVPSGSYGLGRIVLPEAQIMGRPVCVSYSVDFTQPFTKKMRRNRLFVEIR